MESEVKEQKPVSSNLNNSLPAFPHYKVPSKYTKLKMELLWLGLEPIESEIYILLLQDGAKRIVEIESQIGFDRTYIYHLICGLQNKGLVASTFKYPVQFLAVSSDKALKILSKCKRKTAKEPLANNLAELSDAIFAKNKDLKHNFIMLDLDEAYSKAKEM